MTLGPGIDKDAEGHAPFARTTDRSTLEELFSAAAGAGDIPDEPGRRRLSRRQRRRRAIGAGVVLAVVLGTAGAGWAWSNHAAKQPALKALRTGTAAFAPAVEDLRLASDLGEIRDAAADANGAATKVEEAGRSVARPSTDLERRVLAVLRGEAAVLRATADMATLSINTLEQWPALRTRVAAAERALEADVRRLGSVDADAARSVRTGHALAARSTEVVGDFAETTALSRLGEHLDDLTAAGTTKQVRAVAAEGPRSKTVVNRVLAGVDESSPQGTQVLGVSETLASVVRLTKLDGDHLQLWKPVRRDLLAASADLEGVDTAPAVAALDALVAGGEKKLRAWRVATTKATAKAERDTARINDYLEATRPTLQAFEAVTKQAATFFRQVQRGEKGGVTYPDAATFLDGTREDLTAVQTLLADSKPLSGLRAEHRALGDAVDAATKAVRSGYDGIRRPLGCITRPIPRPADPTVPVPDPVCYYGGSAGWATYSSGWLQAAQAFATARTSLTEASQALLDAIEARELPKKPVV